MRSGAHCHSLRFLNVGALQGQLGPRSYCKTSDTHIGCSKNNVRISLCADEKHGFTNTADPDGKRQSGHVPVHQGLVVDIWLHDRVFACTVSGRSSINKSGNPTNQYRMISGKVVEEAKLRDKIIRSSVLMIVSGSMIGERVYSYGRCDDCYVRISSGDRVIKGAEAVS